jgi:hypothetical protein
VERMKHGDMRVTKAEFNDIYNKIILCDQSVVNLCDTIEKVNSPVIQKKQDLMGKIKENKNNIHRLKNAQDQFYVNKSDVNDIVKMIKKNLNYHSELDDLYLTRFLIVENGTAMDAIDDASPKEEKSKPKKGKRAAPAPQPQANTSQIRVIDNQELKKRIKDTIKAKFKFEDKQQCLSRAKAHFMSKDEIVKIIENDDYLKSIMPSNFKKLSKEVLCEHLFEKN